MRKPIQLFLTLLGLVLLFQNCGKSFDGSELGQDFQALDLSSNANIKVPQISLSSVPPLSNLKSVNVSITVSVDPKASLQSLSCQLDSSALVDCMGGQFSASNLDDGKHTLKVNALDNLGHGALEQSVEFQIDTVAPVIMVSQAPAALVGTGPISIVFSASDETSGVASYQCALDTGAFADCNSPQTLSGLSEAAHSFKILSKDKAGNVSAPTTMSFTVSAMAPILNITVKPDAITKLKTANFSFSGTLLGNPLVSYQCARDAGGFAACTSPVAYTNLAEGLHSFSVKGTSQSGVNSAPVSVNWMVDSVSPMVTFASTPAATTAIATANFIFSVSDGGSGVDILQCSLDNAAFAACASPVSLTGLAATVHSFSVRAIDKAGNQGQANFSWTVTAPPTTTTTTFPTTTTLPPTTTTTLAAGGFTGGASLCSGSGLARCESFENNMISNVWNILDNNKQVAPTTVLSARGLSSLRLTGNNRAYIYGSLNGVTSNNTYYGRMFIYFNSVADFNVQNGHDEVVYVQGGNTNAEPRIAVMAAGNGKAYWGVGGIGPSSDWGIADDHDSFAATAQPIPLQKWICLEWMHNGPNTEFSLWTDGVEHPALHITQAILTNPPANFNRLIGQNGPKTFKMPTTMSTIFIGDGDGGNTGLDVFIDELALSPNRIGCAK
jgi:hypothetical protein